MRHAGEGMPCRLRMRHCLRKPRTASARNDRREAESPSPGPGVIAAARNRAKPRCTLDVHGVSGAGRTGCGRERRCGRPRLRRTSGT